MEYTNAFRGKPNQPGLAELTAALGPSTKLWNEFIQWMADVAGVATQEWKGICVNKYGWSLRLKQKSRNSRPSRTPARRFKNRPMPRAIKNVPINTITVIASRCASETASNIKGEVYQKAVRLKVFS